MYFSPRTLIFIFGKVQIVIPRTRDTPPVYDLETKIRTGSIDLTEMLLGRWSRKQKDRFAAVLLEFYPVSQPLAQLFIHASLVSAAKLSAVVT